MVCSGSCDITGQDHIEINKIIAKSSDLWKTSIIHVNPYI